jgi:hypothetical protein
MRTIYEIDYPIYKLPERYNYINRDGLLLAVCKTSFKEYIVDNKNLDFKTMSRRRLSIDTNILPLLKIKLAIFDVISLIKQGTGNYIDSNGYLFRYKTSVKAAIKYYDISKLKEQVEGVGFTFFLKEINRLFQVNSSEEVIFSNYVGIIEMLNDYFIYEFSDVSKPNRIIRI